MVSTAEVVKSRRKGVEDRCERLEMREGREEDEDEVVR